MNKIRMAIWIVVSCIALIVVCVWLAPVEHNPLPDPSDFDEITYSCRPKGVGSEFEGTVSPDQYEEFASLFDDARRDFSPAKWQTAGHCSIVTKSGKEILVCLYRTSHGANSYRKSAISIERRYYRVASDQRFYDFFERNRMKGQQSDNYEAPVTLPCYSPK